MNTGFYHVPKNVKQFYKDCIDLSYKVFIDELGRNFLARENYLGNDVTIGNCTDLLDNECHTVFIDRNVQYPDKEDDHFEAGFTTMEGKAIYVFIFIRRKNAEKLIKKYNLKLME
jgi:hypothetical protein